MHMPVYICACVSHLVCVGICIDCVCVPVVLPRHLSGCPLPPSLWCWPVVCHPDVAAEERRVQLVPGDFPPEPPRTSMATGKSRTAHICVCLLLPACPRPSLRCMPPPPLGLNFPLPLSATPSSYLLLLLQPSPSAFGLRPLEFPTVKSDFRHPQLDIVITSRSTVLD